MIYCLICIVDEMLNMRTGTLVQRGNEVHKHCGVNCMIINGINYVTMNLQKIEEGRKERRWREEVQEMKGGKGFEWLLV